LPSWLQRLAQSTRFCENKIALSWQLCQTSALRIKLYYCISAGCGLAKELSGYRRLA
jgi:hypothetical protein